MLIGHGGAGDGAAEKKQMILLWKLRRSWQRK